MPGHIILQYLEEHPHELLEAIEDKTDVMVKQLEQQERAARRSASGTVRYNPVAEYVSAVPF